MSVELLDDHSTGTGDGDRVNECDVFPEGSRQRAICDGTADLPMHKINRYRDLWGLPPLHGPDRPLSLHPRPTPSAPKPANGKAAKAQSGCSTCGGGQPRAPKPNGHGPGSQLLKLFGDAGVPHCEACIDLAGKMDRWGKLGCAKRIDEIVKDILPRAQEWVKDNRPLIHRFLSLTKLEDVALQKAIRGKVQKAIEQTPDRRQPVKRNLRKFPTGKNWASAFKPTTGTPPYLTTDDLARDALSLIPRLPPDITAVYGSARSGLVPATLLAEMLHLPLTVIRNRQGDTIPAGNGWRLLEGLPRKPGRILVVDDTTMTGNSLLRVKQILEGTPGEKIYCAVYVNPAAVTKPDLWARDLPWPHLLEWNLYNSVLLDSFALDFDGILCRDCPAGDDDDGPRYRKFLREVPPLHLVRKRPIKLIVTARLQKYRPETVSWLDRWGIRVKQLVMGPWPSKVERSRHDVSAWKAGELQRWFRRASGIKPRMFIESDPRQARKIAEMTGGLIVCPAARRCFR